MNYSVKAAGLFVLVNFFILIFAPAANAHRLLIEPAGEGVIRVLYEDGRFSRRTEVVVYNRDKQEIFRGKLDDQGYFYYPAGQEAYLIVADDGIGHRVEWITGSTVGERFPRSITVISVLVICLLIALYFDRRVKRKKAGS